MYGMVTKAIGEMVIDRFGEDAWDEVKRKADVDVDVFISNDGYPDEMTYRLVGAASERLNMPVEDILIEFGRHWILNTAMEGYGPMIRAGGQTLPEFLEQLPNFHTRLSMILPHLSPPRFVCTDITEHSLNLHYHTHRPGFTPFVLGIMQGLSTLYATPLDVTLISSKVEGADHDIFHIAWSAPEAA